jgi:hypothetical protein
VIPSFDPVTGYLPPGEHVASWEEFVDRFANTYRRITLIEGLSDSIDLLAAVGCGRVWINGSFVTAKL